MSTAAGVTTIVGASALGLLTVFVLWRRLPAAAASAVMAACGTGVAVGGLLVQHDVGTASWVVAVVALGVVAPIHARLVFGPPGRAHVVAEEPAAA
ncbi:MAG TPA: hypothetical protein VKB32_06340 [Actinomycetota bacterium]|nr:hypothetical protein [Actinomycetota bacterium]